MSIYRPLDLACYTSPMQTSAVFLRGINVGGRIVKMNDLKNCLEQAGFTNIKTFLQSGNVLLESASTSNQVRTDVETALTDTFNYPAIALVYRIEELKAIISEWPLGQAQPDVHRYVVFYDDDVVLEATELADISIEQVKPGQNCVYWSVPRGNTLDSAFAKAINSSKYKNHVTVRNLHTLQRMCE